MNVSFCISKRGWKQVSFSFVAVVAGEFLLVFHHLELGTGKYKTKSVLWLEFDQFGCGDSDHG